MGLVVGVVGSRSYPNESLVEKHIQYLGMLGYYYNGVTIISGGCEGVDQWAVEYAEECGYHTIEYLPESHDKKGYFARNKQIAKECDLIVAFIPKNQYKSGTWNTIKYTRQFGKPYVVIDEDGRKWDRNWKKTKAEQGEK